MKLKLVLFARDEIEKWDYCFLFENTCLILKIDEVVHFCVVSHAIISVIVFVVEVLHFFDKKMCRSI